MTLPPSPTIDRCKTDVLAPIAFLAGAKLDVFTGLAPGPATAEELAERLAVDPARLSPLLYALVATGLLEQQGGAFRNTDEARHYLVRGSPTFIGDIHVLFEDLWIGAFQAADSVRTGEPLAAHDYARMGDDALRAFFAGQHPDALLAGWKLADVVDLSGARRLADIGGGSGGVAIALCERYRELHATVLDLPDVTRVADVYIAKSACADRVAVSPCDLLRGPLAGDYDVAVMRSLLQVLGPTECREVLRNLHGALVPNARLLILGQILDDDRANPKSVAMFNLIFMSFYREGRAHTEADHRGWLEAAGFHGIERRLTPNGLNMMIARA